jgi:branched-chain amino acid transport system ATP-binding protein
MSVLDNIMVGRHARLATNPLQRMLFLPAVRREEVANREAVERIIEFVELEGVRHAHAGALPFGIQKIVGLARALALEPSLLLLDEPSAGLSPALQTEVFERADQINQAGVSIIMVEQNARRCLQICDRGYVLDQGQNAYTDTGNALLHDPKVIELYLGTLAKA